MLYRENGLRLTAYELTAIYDLSALAGLVVVLLAGSAFVSVFVSVVDVVAGGLSLPLLSEEESDLVSDEPDFA